MQTYSFALFLNLWNQEQGYKTPEIHYMMAGWLEDSWRRGDTRLLLMAFRACGKSSLIGLFAAWLLWRDPDLRILVLAADQTLAGKMVRAIRKIIEKHPLTKSLRPYRPDQWASDRFTIRRPRELRDPSVMAAGVTANITGCRADVIIYDDVEVPNTSDTHDKREALRERLQESNFILTPGGTQLYIGTPHHYFSIYADIPREEIGEDEIFLEGFSRFEQKILDKDGNSVWPEQFSNEDIAQLKRQSGPNKFASQMMLQPVNIMDGRLDHNLLNFYEDDLSYSEAQRQAQLHLMDAKIISCAAWWDPAFGSGHGDDSVLAVVFTDEKGHHYLHHIEYIKVEASEGEDEATLQCRAVIEIIDQFYIPSITIEGNGIGKFLPSILRRELAKKKIACAVVEKHSTQNKALRILEGFDAVLAARALSVHENIKQTPFLMEMMEWQPDKKSGRDDGLDAVAGALSLEPVRIKRFYTSAGKRWSTSSSAHTAKTEFDV
jgi:hypothetical protein